MQSVQEIIMWSRANIFILLDRDRVKFKRGGRETQICFTASSAVPTRGNQGLEPVLAHGDGCAQDKEL